MKAILPLGLMLLALPWLLAEDPASKAKPDTADSREIIFYAESKPVRILVHVSSEEGTPSQVFRKRLKAFFDYLDRDGDGFLDPAEAAFAFSNKGLQSLIETGYAYPSPNDAGRAFDKFDANKDGKISFEEFEAYYAPCGHLFIADRPLGEGDPHAGEITKAFFERLDANEDGKLSREELAVLPSWIEKYDRDEDDCLSIEEIMPGILDRPKKAISQSNALGIHRADEFSESAIETLMLRYDHARNLRLKPSDIGFDPETFKMLDKNGDGLLSMFELADWRKLPADLEIEMKLGKASQKSSIRVRKPANGLDSPLARQCQPMPDGSLIVKVGLQTIHFAFLDANGSEAAAALSNGELSALFQQAAQGKDHLFAGDLGDPGYRKLRELFALADRDGDGKLTPKELDRLLVLFDSFRDSPLQLAHTVETPSLFRMLDQNGDGRLSLRELRQAWDRLHPFDSSDEDHLTANLVLPQAKVSLTRGQTEKRRSASNPYEVSLDGDGRGPVWFRKLDRNGDGDISLKEFPGTKAEFDRLDLNGDGLISLEEAEAAEKRYRRK